MKNFYILTFATAVAYIAIGISSPLVTLYLEGLGAGYLTISLILTSSIAVMLVGNYGLGRLADRTGRRKPLLVAGLLLLAITWYALSRVSSPGAAWAVRLVEGVGYAAFNTLGLTMLGDILHASTRKGQGMGLSRGIGSAAFALGAFMGGRLADAYSLQAALALCAALYLLSALATLAVEETPAPPAQRTAPTGAPPAPARGLTGGLPLLFLAGVLLWITAHSASTTLWPNYMETLGYSATTISSLWGLAALVEFPAMVVSGVLSDTLGRAALLAAGGLSMTLVQIGYLALAAFLPALLVTQVFRGFGFGSYTSTAMTYTAEYGEQATRGSRSGAFFAVSSAGQLLGMLMSGVLAQSFGFGIVYAVCIVLMALSAVCFLALKRRRERTTYAAAH